MVMIQVIIQILEKYVYVALKMLPKLYIRHFGSQIWFLIWFIEWEPDQFQVFVVYMCRQHKTLSSYNAKHTSPLIIANVGTSAQIADDK